MKKISLALALALCCVAYPAAAGILDYIETAGGMIAAVNPLVGGVIAAGAGLYELVRRQKKTERPGGIFHDIARGLYLLADIVAKLAEISDRVLPQKSDSHKIKD